jgi:hypothetical protein
MIKKNRQNIVQHDNRTSKTPHEIVRFLTRNMGKAVVDPGKIGILM